MKTVLRIANLDCPVCAGELQSELQNIDGVRSVFIDYVGQKIVLEYDGEQVLQKVVDRTNGFEEVRVLTSGSSERKASRKKEWLCVLFSILCLVAGVWLNFGAQRLWLRIIAYGCYGLAYLSVGFSVLFSMVKNVAKGKIFDENFLMTVASLGAMAIGEVFEGVIVMLLYQIGELLQAMAVGSSRRSVAALMDLKSEWATLIKDGQQKRVKPEELQVGDLLFVKVGEKIPTDGILLSNSAVLDTKSLTGEANLREVQKGGELLSGCINSGGVLMMKVTRPYENSAVKKILDMVENASEGKAKPEKFITKFAKYYTPIVCGLALFLVLVAPPISGLLLDGRFYYKNWLRWMRSALTFLVVSCPCALVISVPLTYFSGIGTCAKNGILIKGATYLDILAQTRVLALDKTGTLTEGAFRIQKVTAFGECQESEILAIAATVEKDSSHPISSAFTGIESVYSAENTVELAGRGLRSVVNGKTVLIGNQTLLTENGIACMETQTEYATAVYVAMDGVLLGVIEIGDSLRSEAKESVEKLRLLGIERTAILTGDKEKYARRVAEEIGISETYAELLPDEKWQTAQMLKQDGKLLYVGDGINDAPVMATADCAVSMGSLGSAAAVEASDIVLISDDLRALPKGVRIAKKTRSIVLQNILFSIVMKVGFMALGAIGILPLGLAVFADVGVMLLAVLNSFRVRKLK